MRYFFHIVDKYGISPDQTGYEHGDQNAAVLHASRIAAELAKAGEFSRLSIVLVADSFGNDIQSRSGRSRCLHRDGPAAKRHADFLPVFSTENP